jgi:hypothetical protein
MTARRRRENNVSKQLVINKELVKVKGRVKAITVKKEDFHKFLQSRKLRVLDKEYDALMPPLDDMKKNTIDVNGLATLLQQYLASLLTNSGNTNQTAQAEMVLTTQSGNVNFSYAGGVGVNSQGVTVYLQVFEEGGNFTFQYFYIGFDTTDASYTTSQIELYASASVYTGNFPGSNVSGTYYTDTVRIAYTSASFSKTADSYLFIVWLIQFQNVPPYAVFSVPTFQNNAGVNAFIAGGSSTSYRVYFNSGSCNFTCGGNCPSTGLGGFVTNVQNNSVVLEFPLAVPLNAGVSNLEILFCGTTSYQNMATISGYISTTLTPSVSGATFYVAIATIAVTYQTS